MLAHNSKTNSRHISLGSFRASTCDGFSRISTKKSLMSWGRFSLWSPFGDRRKFPVLRLRVAWIPGILRPTFTTFNRETILLAWQYEFYDQSVMFIEPFAELSNFCLETQHLLSHLLPMLLTFTCWGCSQLSDKCLAEFMHFRSEWCSLASINLCQSWRSASNIFLRWLQLPSCSNLGSPTCVSAKSFERGLHQMRRQLYFSVHALRSGCKPSTFVHWMLANNPKTNPRRLGLG